MTVVTPPAEGLQSWMHVLRPQTTMMDADGPVSDRKTEAHAARGAIARIVYAEERLENLGQQFLGNSWAGITNVNQNRLIGDIAAHPWCVYGAV